MTIRPMTLSDYNAVYALWLSCDGVGLRSLDESEAGISRFLQRNPTTCFVALRENTLVGVLLCGHDGRRGYIYHAAVSPDCRCQGIGSALLEAALDALRKEGIHKAALVAFKHNAAGSTFWEKRGFLKRTDLDYRDHSLNSENV